MSNQENIYVVRSHPVQGFQFFFRAGRAWPASGIEVVLVIDEDDPVAPDDYKGPLKIGQKTFAAISAEKHISIVPKGEAVSVVEALKARIAELEAKNAELEKAITESAKKAK